MSTRPKLLIFAIAYHAESTLEKVLDRIPEVLFEEAQCEVLVVDDASTDRTFEVGTNYQRAKTRVPMTVLRNGFNQGYGGNQKVGYHYAALHGFDFVALLHADGQYAPEELPRLLEPLVSGEADAVFGSRMLEGGSALKGGMPLYKFVGNKILTRLQNTLLRSRLSEFHSGYRLYSVPMLSRLPLRLNSNDFHFDTEIIIQLMNAGARIKELPIPTYYGDEVCHVNGMKYAKDVMSATLQNVVHRSGLLYQRRFDTNADDNTHYDLKLGYPSSHSYALDAVAPNSRVLDVGAGPGGLAQELTKKGCHVTVVDRQPGPSADPRVTVVQQDLNEEPRFNVAQHDTVLMLDIIEHLASPERFLERIRQQFDYDEKRIILTTPNIGFLAQRLMLAFGEFNYGRAGILDRTHTRLFTFRSLLRLLSDEGFVVEEVKGVPAPFPKVLGNGLLGRAATMANLALIRVNKAMFSYQIYVRARSSPDVSFVLSDAVRKSEPAPPLAAAAAGSTVGNPPVSGYGR